MRFILLGFVAVTEGPVVANGVRITAYTAETWPPEPDGNPAQMGARWHSTSSYQGNHAPA